MARPEHKATDAMKDEVGRWAAAGLTQERCAALVGLSLPTFRKHYSDAYDGGKDNMVKSLFAKSFEVAMSDDHKDASRERQFLLKTRGGYSEKQEIEHSGGVTLKGFEVNFVGTDDNSTD